MRNMPVSGLCFLVILLPFHNLTVTTDGKRRNGCKKSFTTLPERFVLFA